MIWRRSYDIPPLALDPNDPRVSFDNPRYAELRREEIPLTECLKDTVERVLPYWNDVIVPAVREGRQILICAHGNSLRGLIKHLDDISNADIVKVNIPNAQPLVYELDAALKPIRSFYLGDAAAIETAIKNIAHQGKAS
jgi:2,3-bisphosphoglycerate-dependent phosphoglycerate mutase